MKGTMTELNQDGTPTGATVEYEAAALPPVRVEALVLAVRDAMEMLENMSVGGIGDGGPTIDELDAHVEKTGQSYDNDSDYHTAQWTWRKLQHGLNSQNTKAVGTEAPKS